MTILIAVVSTAICLAVTMAAAWQVALRSGQSGWIDAIWSLAVGVSGAVLALWPFTGDTFSLRQILVAALVLGWSLRLALHITARTAGGGDDPRYAHLRAEWGDSFKSRLFWFLQIQAAVAMVLAIAVMAAAHNPAPGFHLSDAIGIAVAAPRVCDGCRRALHIAEPDRGQAEQHDQQQQEQDRPMLAREGHQVEAASRRRGGRATRPGAPRPRGPAAPSPPSRRR